MIRAIISVSLLLLLIGCASYNASPLANYDSMIFSEAKDEISVTCKKYTTYESIKYLGRDVQKKGYQPLQLAFRNPTSKTYLFSTEKMSLTSVPWQEVASKVHTSTPGRVAGYTASALLFTPMIIPAIVDGMRSYEANQQLDIDYAEKAMEEVTIHPNSYVNTIVFVPIGEIRKGLKISLMEGLTGEEKAIQINTFQ